jgi:MFS family permease
MLPMTIGFIVMGPISGILSDKYGSRWIATAGMVLMTVAFLGIAALPVDFDYLQFAIALFVMGVGNGMFAAPNTASIMNSVPPEERGVASGMRSTLQNTAQTASMGLFFTIVIVSLTSKFPAALATSLSSIGASSLLQAFSAIPPTGALFAAFLGYNPVTSILGSMPSAIVASIPQGTIDVLTGSTWFPSTLAQSLMASLRLSFLIGAALCAVAAVLSAMRGERYVNEASEAGQQELATGSGSPEK